MADACVDHRHRTWRNRLLAMSLPQRRRETRVPRRVRGQSDPLARRGSSHQNPMASLLAQMDLGSETAGN